MKKTVLIINVILSIMIMTPVMYCEDIMPVQDESIPVESTPVESTAVETIPEVTVPEETVPEVTIPEEIIPEEIIPEEIIPEEIIPEGSVPEQDPAPTDDTVILPDGTIPAGGMDTPAEGDQVTPSDSTSEISAAGTAAGGTPSVTLSPANVNAGSLVAGNTLTLTRAATLTITSKNTAWNLTASGSNFTSGSKSIPVGRMSIKVSTASIYVPLTSTPLTLLSNQAGTSGNGTVTIYVDYQITLQSSDSSGLNYANSITFTVTAH